jgi:glycosyltransferase involved in cell wall biosynthesis
MISVLILTLNEEDNLPRCLDALDWADDVLVVDSFSTDRTVEIAEARGARVVQRRFDDFAGQRNFGLTEGGLKHEWVLHLDADEVVPSELRDEMFRVIEDDSKDAYRVPSKMMLHGRWLRHAGMYPAYQVRLGRREALQFEQVGHGQRETLPSERVGTLEHAFLHYSFSKGLDDWFEKHNRYSTAEARLALEEAVSGEMDWAGLVASDGTRRRRALKKVAARFPFRPTLRFLYMYVLRRGFLDGAAGYTYCRLLSMYEAMTVLKIKEQRLRDDGTPL